MPDSARYCSKLAPAARSPCLLAMVVIEAAKGRLVVGSAEHVGIGLVEKPDQPFDLVSGVLSELTNRAEKLFREMSVGR